MRLCVGCVRTCMHVCTSVHACVLREGFYVSNSDCVWFVCLCLLENAITCVCFCVYIWVPVFKLNSSRSEIHSSPHITQYWKICKYTTHGMTKRSTTESILHKRTCIKKRMLMWARVHSLNNKLSQSRLRLYTHQHQKTQTAQNRSVWAITGCMKATNTRYLHRQSNILPISDHVNMRCIQVSPVTPEEKQIAKRHTIEKK